jgi:hypothetical protein
MDSAKKIAREMLDAINVDGSGLLGAVAKGFISFPVTFGYLGYDFIDTGHRRENLDDKDRLARLVKTATFNRHLIEKVIAVFIDDFTARIDRVLMAEKIGGSIAGGIIFSQLTGFKIGSAISERAVQAFIAGTVVISILSIGAEASRAIYTSRYLRERNPVAYYKLKGIGDLDLLYFLIEDAVKPFEKACEVSNANKEEFNNICQYFLGGL